VLSTLAIDPDNPTMEKQVSAIKVAVKCYLVVGFLLGYRRVRYGPLIEQISNKFL
jgi:hypothetical protein